jgi:tetratricopeptide (TPR) repeat protein
MNAYIRRYGLPAAAVLAVYFNAFGGAFQFDDYNVIVDNPGVHSFPAWLAGLFTGIRPLLKLTYTLNWTSGWGLFGFHLFNVSVHAANGVLVYILSRKFFDWYAFAGTAGESNSVRPVTLQQNSGNALTPEFAAMTAALLFALHPVQTEAVTYICGRSTSLMALFYFGSMLAYIRGAERRGRLLLYALSPILFAAAVAVKETALTLPFALVLWEASGPYAKRWRDIARLQAAHWAVFVVLALYLLINPSYSDLLIYGLASRSLADNLLSQINGVSYLLSRLVWVHRLSIDPGLPVAHGWTLLLGAEAVLLLALLLAGLVGMRKRPWLGFGLLWFFLHLLPTNSVVPRLDLANERQLYLASWGIFLALGGELLRLRSSAAWSTRTVRAAVAAILLMLGCFTVMRNQVYRTEVSLWEDTVRTSPDNARAHNNLGFAYFHAGRNAEAMAEYREALRLQPDYERAEENLAALAQEMADHAPSP